MASQMANAKIKQVSSHEACKGQMHSGSQPSYVSNEGEHVKEFETLLGGNWMGSYTSACPL